MGYNVLRASTRVIDWPGSNNGRRCGVVAAVDSIPTVELYAESVLAQDNIEYRL